MTKKQTSDRVSRLAAKWLKNLKHGPTSAEWGYWLTDTEMAQLRAICASVLSQDEVKGKRKKRRAA